ncbi:MAG: class I SAM-dependent methyltransferase, partial [Chitinophagales bacterium]
MENSFEQLAASYDREFSDTLTGRAQRNIVWNYLLRNNINNKTILELNCGTGEDAVFLASKNQVTATDGSQAMLDITQSKILKAQLESKCAVLLWDLNQPFPAIKNNQYDFVFSNFGGLNCLSNQAIIKLSEEINHLIKPGGSIVMVIMGRFCLWEWIYFTMKGKYVEARRRKSKNAVNAKLGEIALIDIWYYSPDELKKCFGTEFNLFNKKPVGIFIPPSYINYDFRNK